MTVWFLLRSVEKLEHGWKTNSVTVLFVLGLRTLWPRQAVPRHLTKQQQRPEFT